MGAQDIDTILIDTEKFICQNCGGIMKHDIKSGKFICSACKEEKTLEVLSDTVKEYDFGAYRQREEDSVPFDGMAVVACQSCGLEITLEDAQIAATCPMCGSTQIAGIKQHSGIPPEGIVPFKIDRHDAQKRFSAWVKSRWFAPNDFKKRYGEGALNGMYLPFWTYDASVLSHYNGEGGMKRKVRGDDEKEKTVTDWYPVKGAVTSFFDDIQVCASKKVADVHKILPYDTINKIEPYSSGYLSGYYAEIYKIKADAAFEDAKKIIEKQMESLARNKVLKRYDSVRIHSLKTTYSNISYKHVLLPMWSSAFGYKGNKYSYIVNGETGKVSGERPYSVIKITIAVLAAIVIIIMAFLIFGDDELSAATSSTMSQNSIEINTVQPYHSIMKNIL